MGRLIFEPTLPPSAITGVYQAGSMMQPVLLSNTGQAVFTVQFPTFTGQSHPITTAREAALAWVTSFEPDPANIRDPRLLHISNGEIKGRLWHRIDIQRWIDDFSIQDVYVSITGETWTFCFMDPRDHNNFINWFSNQKLNFNETKTISTFDLPAVRQWIVDTCAGRSRWRDAGNGQMQVAFEHEGDRMMFMLRWTAPKREVEDSIA